MNTEIPEWVDKTPDPPEYDLVMWDAGGSSEENIEVTREEYIALKAHLAGMRGYRIGTAAEAVRMVMECPGLAEYNTLDEQQIASHIETARDVYRWLPDLVVCQSAQFQAEINRLAAVEMTEEIEQNEAAEHA